MWYYKIVVIKKIKGEISTRGRDIAHPGEKHGARVLMPRLF